MTHATIQKTDTRNDEEDQGTHDDLIDIMKLKAGIWKVDIGVQWVSAIGNGLVERGKNLVWCLGILSVGSRHRWFFIRTTDMFASTTSKRDCLLSREEDH